MSVRYRRAVEADAAALVAVFHECFVATFGHLYAKTDLDAFLAEHTPEHWTGQLRDPEFAVRVAEQDGVIAGFAKIGPLKLPADTEGPALELRQIYLRAAYQGQGIAAALMDWTIAEARVRGAAELFLSVYTENQRARRLYERYGFTEVGPYAFMVGSQADEDIIMRLAL